MLFSFFFYDVAIVLALRQDVVLAILLLHFFVGFVPVHLLLPPPHLHPHQHLLVCTHVCEYVCAHVSVHSIDLSISTLERPLALAELFRPHSNCRWGNCRYCL